MNGDERRVLHGLYCDAAHHAFREVWASSEQLLWLMQRRWPCCVRKWRSREGLQSADPDRDEDSLRSEGEPLPRIEETLRLLQHDGYIERVAPSHQMELRLTSKGIKEARRLNRPFGYLDSWYREHRWGVVGLIVPVLFSGVVSFAVALVTIWLRTG